MQLNSEKERNGCYLCFESDDREAQKGQKELDCVFVDLEKAYDNSTERGIVVLHEEVSSSREV